VNITSHTPIETERIGACLGALLTRGDVVALAGELGTGKTTLVRGIAAGMGFEDGEVTSPSFTLINEYEGPLPLFHIDLYRLEDEKELLNIDFEEYMRGDGVVVIEWADKIHYVVPHESLWITLRYLDSEKREIVLRAQADHYEMMIEELQKRVYNKKSL
jgi:tRNA threonylcarbamoyladenosine biosynthesis protein TsaE